jgi:tetratricopeptide (TPR) repeat protein
LFLLVLLLLLTFSDSLMAEDDKLLFEKSRLLAQKGQKAEERGDIEEAVSCYEDAYNAYPKNILPILLWGKALYRVGMYSRAEEVLGKIPIEKLPDKGKAEVFLLQGRIAIASNKLEDAAAAFSRAVKAAKGTHKAVIRLAMVNQVLGMTSRADELLNEYESFAELPMKEQVMALLLDLQLGNLGRAFSTCGELPRFMKDANYPEERAPSMIGLWKVQPLCFIGIMPVALGVFFSAVYFVLLFSALMFLASRLSPATAFWHDLAFVLLGSGLMLATQNFGLKGLLQAAMLDQFSAYDSVWIVPRLAISGHFVALGLFLIFPAFHFLPPEQRPRRFEYYGIWFFCWFFMIFVLAFQSRMESFGLRVGLMAGGLILAFITSFFMPLGRFILYKLTSILGISGFAEVDRKDLKSGSGVSFTDAKILEAKVSKLMAEGDFDEVIMTARKVLNSHDKKTFPQLWKTMILAFIIREDFIEAQKAIAEFNEVMLNTGLKESGQLLEAYLRCCRGDYAGALKIIRSFPDDRVKSFAPDEDALSLLILGRCGIFYKENVQAHIDLNKSFSCARLPIIKAESLVELIELDFNMRSKDAIAKWVQRADEFKGGKKSQALKTTVRSIAAMAQGDSESALSLALEACKLFPRNGRAFAWYGHLLCMSGKHSEAEELLTRMTPDSVDANRLMTEVTGS